jgi:hypothetical protein
VSFIAGKSGRAKCRILRPILPQLLVRCNNRFLPAPRCRTAGRSKPTPSATMPWITAGCRYTGRPCFFPALKRRPVK